jgi:muramidase (phage lysozyme)
MASHPLDYEAYPTVNPAGAPSGDFEDIHANPEMFGGLLGKAEETFGGGLEKASDAGFGALIQRQQLNNQIHASELHSDFSDKGNDLVSQFSQLQGRAAIMARPDFESRLKQLQKEAEDQSGNLSTKAMVSENTRRSMDFFAGIITRHADTQNTVWAQNTAKDNINSAIGVGGLAVVNVDMGQLDDQMRRINLEAHNYFDPMGYEDEALKEQVGIYKGKAVKNWVETAATNPKDPDGLTHALEIFERYTKDIDPNSRLEISKYLTAKAQARTVDKLSNYYLAPPGTTVRSDLSPQMRGLLDTIAGGETLHGGYNELYTGKSVESVKPGFDYSDHPRVMFPAQYGPTSAFGRYQITKTTWDEDRERYGLSDITPESQDTWAAKKASELYEKGLKAGQFSQFPGLTGNLDDDLKAHSKDVPFLDAVGHALSHEWTSAPGGLQPNPQTATWGLRFRNNIARNSGETSLPDADEIISRISTDPLLADRPELKKQILQTTMAKLSVAQRGESIAQRQAKETSDAAELDIFKRIHTDDPSLTVGQILDNPNLSKDAKERMTLAYEKASGQTDKAEKTYGQGFYDFYRRIHLPEGDPARVTDPAQLYGHVGPNGDLTVQGVDKLVTEIQSRRSPEGVAESEMRAQFFRNARSQITGANEGLGVKDHKGDELYLKFMAQALNSYDAGRKAGKPATALLNPDSPDYIGKSIQNFKRPTALWYDDMLQDNPGMESRPADQAAAPKTDTAGAPVVAKPPAIDPASVKSLDQLITLYKRGAVSKAQADQIAISNGWGYKTPKIPSEVQ